MTDQPATLKQDMNSAAAVDSLDIDMIQCQALFAQQARERDTQLNLPAQPVRTAPWGQGLRWG